jgi:hypothetical protein
MVFVGKGCSYLGFMSNAGLLALAVLNLQVQLYVFSFMLEIVEQHWLI